MLAVIVLLNVVMMIMERRYLTTRPTYLYSIPAHMK
jgi:hypothetical protein